MIEEVRGNLLCANADALVNPVNTVGVMGKGLALLFKKAYPANFWAYAEACHSGKVRPGRMFVFETGLPGHPRFIINFPTKRHWRESSRLSDIAAGLFSLRRALETLDIESVAIPALGCGNGGLEWDAVLPLIAAALGDLHGVQVMVYPPAGAP